MTGDAARMTPSKRRLLAALMSLAGVLAGLAAAEVYLRSAELRVDDPYLHHTYKKNAEVAHQGIAYRTNSLGFRDRAPREVGRRTERRFRILVLGDSFAAGSKVDYEDCFAARLEAMFRRDGEDVEVLNGGVTSLSPSLEYRKLARFLDQGYAADMVVLMLDISDVMDEAGLGGAPERKTWASVASGSRVVQQLRRVRRDPDRGLDWDDPRAGWTELDWAAHPWIEEGLRRCQQGILDASRLCRQRGMPFLLVFHPWPHQLRSSRRPSPQQTIFSDFAKRQGVTFHDLFPAFFALEDWRSCYLPGDGHWNKDGHALVARSLYARLRALKARLPTADRDPGVL
ncbi:MAG: SGNH/GDSL hydrolase family protein [Elusimicrobia bacterium]|nr:SGNH/GDSL hydrolase family protein [Elusimicrobiota bacterium]